MTSIQSLTLEVPDPTAATSFYTAAFDLGDRLDVRASEAPTSGFRGCTLSLVVSQPATVDGLIGAALHAGATPLKPVKKSLWGYGGVIQAPDGTIWKVATSSKKDTGPATREINEIVILLGAEDVAASKRFYMDHGLKVDKSFAHKYVEFAHPAASSWRSTAAARSPRTPAFPQRAADRTGSSSAAMPDRSPTRTGLPGSRRTRHPVRRSRLRRPRSRRPSDPHPSSSCAEPSGDRRHHETA